MMWEMFLLLRAFFCRDVKETKKSSLQNKSLKTALKILLRTPNRSPVARLCGVLP